VARIARFLHISDVHLGAFAEDPIRRRDVAAAFARALEIAIVDGADFVVLAGDLFDRKIVSPDVLHGHARAALERLRDASIPVFAIEGNHDEAVHGARHSWVTYLGTEGLLVPLRPVLSPSISWPADETKERPAGRAVAHGGITILGMGYLGPRTEEILRALPDLEPSLGENGPAIVLLHAMRSPFDTLAEPGTFTEGALDSLSRRNVYLALGHGHRRTISAGVERPARFVAASPGSLEYIHETDFHLEDPRGAILVDVLEDGSFSVMPKDTLKRPRCVVHVDLGTLALPEDVIGAALARCREAAVPEGAILGVILQGTPGFARAQVPVPALERRIRDELAPVSVEVRFEEDQVEVASGASEGERADDVASTLELLLAERAPGADKAALARLAAFVAPRVGDGGAWRATEEGSELDDALALLLDVVAGPQAGLVRDVLAGLE
jgi:DNA repair exonuclease SbcCD nuclease subunit